MASGSTVKVALELGRKAIRVELEEGRFNQTTEEIRGFSQGS
ncbi:site-specific DNA-methyltransferase [Enterobacter asburiae]|nr:site-specific DNA-methyltransferase [Enterobacter asburiae]